MLTHFKAFQHRHTDGVPRFCSLFQVYHQGRDRPYAWIDNLAASHTLRITSVLLEGDSIPAEKVSEAVRKLTNDKGSHPDDLLTFCIDKAEATLVERKTKLAEQGRKYGSSRYYDLDCAMLLRPAYGSSRQKQLLAAARDGISEESVSANPWASYQPAHVAPWQWEDYRELVQTFDLLRCLYCRIPPYYLHADFSQDRERLKEQTRAIRRFRRAPSDYPYPGPDKRRTSTPKGRLALLQEKLTELGPISDFRPMQHCPAPMLEYTEKQIAQLPIPEMLQLLAKTYTWWSFYCLMDAAHNKGDTLRAPRADWDPQVATIPQCCYRYTVEDNELVPYEQMCPEGISQLPELAVEFGCEFKLPKRKLMVADPWANVDESQIVHLGEDE